MRGIEVVMSPKSFNDDVMVNSTISSNPILKTNSTI